MLSFQYSRTPFSEQELTGTYYIPHIVPDIAPNVDSDIVPDMDTNIVYDIVYGFVANIVPGIT